MTPAQSARAAQIKALRKKGLKRATIARRLGLSNSTVDKALYVKKAAVERRV